MKWVSKLTLGLFIFSLFYGWSFFRPSELNSATLTSAKDLLESSRLSYSTALEGNHSIGQTTITIDTANYPDKNNFHIFPGDLAHIGSNNYTVGTVIDDANDNKFTITTGLQSGDTADNTKIYVDQSAKHIVTFTTVSAVAKGAIRVSVPANTNDTNNSDGNPDPDGFDLNSVGNNDVTCPDVGVYDFATAAHTATDAGTSGWHTFECRYSGNGSSSTSLTMTIGGTQELLNTAPSATHVRGTADSYTIRIQNLSASDVVVDSVDARVVLIEAVRVSATVEATLSFTIAGLSSGSHCGQAIDVTTTAYSVPFGSLATTSTFYDTTQQLTVGTNADSGYLVTVFEDDELGKDGADTPNIPDTPCNSGPCTHTTSVEWNAAANYGFGYSLENVTGSDAKFTYSESARTFSAKQFPNRTEGSTQDQDTNANIMSNAGPVSANSLYVCYRISVSGIQEAGNYYNTITYIATPIF